MKILELFSGTQSISKVFKENGWETFTIDFNDDFADITDIIGDILNITPQEIEARFGRPDVIWASPPCEKFSVAAIGRHWNKVDGLLVPKVPAAEVACQIVLKAIEIIEYFQPKYFFIENPRGALRKMPFMQDFDRYTVTYCQYGDFRMKPTDLWTNHPNPEFKPPCKNGMPCHTPAPRGSQTGTQGMGSYKMKSMIPKELCEHVEKICRPL